MMTFLLAAFAAVAIYGLVQLAFGGRAKSVTRRARELSTARGWSHSAPASPVLIARGNGGALDRIAHRFVPRPAALRARLEATGRPLTIGQYAAASAGLAVALTVLQLMIGGAFLSALLFGIAGGIFLPHFVVGRLGARRSTAFLKALPDAIGLIVRGLRAGLPVTETIAVVAREIPDPVGDEFRTITDQVRFGRPLEEAMWDTARRLRLPEFDFLVISLSVQRETGGNLAETLENLAHILRSRGQLRRKIKAMSSEATASAVIIGSLPFVMATLMMLFSPEYLAMLFVNALGQMMFAAGLASLLAGAMIMRKMVRFEI